MDNLCLYGLIQNFYRRIIAKRAWKTKSLFLAIKLFF
jgi:hypothetical protein